MALPGSFYERTAAGTYVPSVATTSPWDDTAQHGGPPAALLATILDQHVGDPGLRLARFNTEMLRPIPRRELSVEVEDVRPGRKVRMTRAAMVVDGTPVVLASAWHLAVGDTPVPVPDGPAGTPPAARPGEAQEQRYFPGLTSWGYGEATEWRFASGSLAEPGPSQVWTRVRIPLVDAEPLTGLQRLLIVADSVNGLSGVLPLRDWWFIPPALTVVVHRHPDGEWVHLDTSTELAADGLGTGYGRLADEHGWLGHALQPLHVAPRT